MAPVAGAWQGLADGGKALLDGLRQVREAGRVAEEVVGEELPNRQLEAGRVVDLRVEALRRPAAGGRRALQDGGQISLGDEPLEERRNRREAVVRRHAMSLGDSERPMLPDEVHDAPLRGWQGFERGFHRRVVYQVTPAKKEGCRL